MTEEKLLLLAASLEKASEHPLAAAIVAGAGERGSQPWRCGRFRLPIPARGSPAMSREPGSCSAT